VATKQRPAVIHRPAPVAEVVPAPPPVRLTTTFDLFFVSYPMDGDWGGVMLALERSPWRTRRFGERDHALWERMLGRVEPLLPGSDVRAIPGMYELTHAGSGIQFAFVPGGIVLSVPYWYAGEDADRLVALLQRIAVAVESETALTAYDPQAEAPFLAYGASSAAETLRLHGPPSPGGDGAPTPQLPKVRGWRRLCHRC